jgi:hypothetical protein
MQHKQYDVQCLNIGKAFEEGWHHLDIIVESNSPNVPCINLYLEYT